MTPTLSKMARAALGWSIKDLAKAASLGVNTVSRYENGADTYASTEASITAAFEAKGLTFLPENGGGVGIRLPKKRRGKN